VLRNRGLKNRTVFGPKSEGGNRRIGKLDNEKLHNLCSSKKKNIISDKMKRWSGLVNEK
jgi:hypothetical protein